MTSPSPVGGRLAAVAGAGLMALASRGDVWLLAVVLGLAAARLSSGVATSLAATAVAVRWGSSSLGAVAGAQSVLGPAGWTGGAADVTSAWLAAIALVTAAVGLPRSAAASRLSGLAGLAPALPFGAAAAAAVAGPGVGGALGVRAGATVVAVALACLVMTGRRGRPRLDWSLVAAAVAAGAGAVTAAVIAT